MSRLADLTRILPWAPVAVLALAGCGEPETAAPRPTDEPSAERSAPEDAEDDVMDVLRGIGYADAAEEVSDPEEERISIHDAERVAPGYNLFESKVSGAVYLMDNSGEVVHKWRHEGESWTNPTFLPGGDLLLPGFGPKPPGTRGRPGIARLSWDGREVWRIWLRAHHDVEYMPDGRVATLGAQMRVIPAVHPEYRVRDESVAIIAADGSELLEEYSLYDMLVAAPDVFQFQELITSAAHEREGIDLLHSNAVEFMHHDHLVQRSTLYAPGNVLVTIRHQDAVVIFDLEAGRAVWAWGQGEISAPHDGHVLASGNILLFDNGLARKWSRAVELDPLTREIVWEWRAPEPTDFFTAGRGSAQRLPNGNTLLADSDSGIAIEVTHAGEVVWRFRHFDLDDEGRRSTFARIHRVPPELVEGLLDR